MGLRFGSLSFIPLLEILYGQPHVFRAMNSWKRLSLSMTPGARMQMISAPNIDSLDVPPLTNRGRMHEGCCRHRTREAAETSFGQALYCLGHTRVPRLRPGRNNAMMSCECQKCPSKKIISSTATRGSLLRQRGGGLARDLPCHTRQPGPAAKQTQSLGHRHSL